MSIKSPIYIGLFLICALVVGTFFTIPKYQEWLSFSKEVSRLQTEIQGQSEYFDYLKNISEELKNYEDKVSKINAALPDDPSFSSLGALLNVMASRNGLILNKLTKGSTIESRIFQQAEIVDSEETGTEVETKTETGTETEVANLAKENVKVVKETTVDLFLTGFYPSFKNFLIDIEKSARLIEIERISIDFIEEEDGIFNFNLILKVYSY